MRVWSPVGWLFFPPVGVTNNAVIGKQMREIKVIWRWVGEKNRDTSFFRGARNSHPARLQDFWSLKGNQPPVREAQVKRRQRARGCHLAQWVESRVRGLWQTAQCQHWLRGHMLMNDHTMYHHQSTQGWHLPFLEQGAWHASRVWGQGRAGERAW